MNLHGTAVHVHTLCSGNARSCDRVVDARLGTNHFRIYRLLFLYSFQRIPFVKKIPDPATKKRGFQYMANKPMKGEAMLGVLRIGNDWQNNFRYKREVNEKLQR